MSLSSLFSQPSLLLDCSGYWRGVFPTRRCLEQNQVNVLLIFQTHNPFVPPPVPLLRYCRHYCCFPPSSQVLYQCSGRGGHDLEPPPLHLHEPPLGRQTLLHRGCHLRASMTDATIDHSGTQIRYEGTPPPPLMNTHPLWHPIAVVSAPS